MLGNCEKMVLISSSSNQWPQMKNHPTNLDHQKGLNLMGSSSGLIMDKPSQQDHKPQQQQNQDPALRCPRCDSSNTKFCYYNNYSLSQPRHFCKACKRYWTRGGTLRTVPVGGGCRKNKRLKRPTSAASAAATHSSSTSNPLHNPHNMFYGGSTSSDLNLSFSGYDHHHHHHHLQPHLNFLGLGFDHTDFNFNGFNSSSLLSGYSSLFPNNPSSTSVSSLLASKFSNGLGFKSVDQNLDSPPFDHRHVMGSNGGDQVEDGIMKRLDWNNQLNQTDEIVAQSNNDPNSLYTNWSSQIWHDPTNLGSSITSSLI